MTLPPLSLRFGDGYTIILRLMDSKSPEDSCPIDTYIRNSFPGIELKERHQNVLQYQLPSYTCCLARVFDVLANNFEELGIIDYSVSQTTLDQVRPVKQLGFRCFAFLIVNTYFCKRISEKFHN